MTMFPTYGVPAPSSPLDALSRDLFEQDFANIEWSPLVGASQIIAATGHLGSFSRGATLASVADADGVNTYTAVNNQPAWEQRDWDGDTIRESFGLKMGTSDRLAYPAAFRVMPTSFLLEFIETGAISTANATLLAYSNDAASGARWWISTSGTLYQLNYTDGTTTRTATLAAAPTTGDRVQLYGEISATGVATLFQNVNGSESVVSAAALTLPASWVASASVRLNSQGTSANPGQAWYRRARIMPSALNLSALLARR